MSDEKRRTAVQFRSAAESHFDSEVHRLGMDREMPVSWCRGATCVFDVATRAGHIADVAADAGVSSVVAADIAPEMVATAVREYLVAGVVVDVKRLPFVDDVFDTAACRTATRYFPGPEAFAAEVVRAPEPGDIFALEDNVAPEDAALTAFPNGVEVFCDLTHVELHPVSRWRERFVVAGLSAETVGIAAIRFQLDPWTERTNVSPVDRDEPERRFRETPEETKELLDAEFDGDSVVSFINPKALVRARTE